MNQPEQDRVTVLLATYNASLFLAEQLASLDQQEYRNWRLLVRDDGSNDDTCQVLKRLQLKGERVELLDTSGRNLGPARNFSALIAAAVERDLPYVAFCDQDDVWRPEKLSLQMKAMRRLEQLHGIEMPILVCSDLELVSRDLRPIHQSFMAYQGIRNPHSPALTTLVFQNHVVGCTMLANRALLNLAHPQPSTAYMHDWWLALCALSGGVLEMLPQPLVAYRQHSANRVGAGGVRRLSRPRHWRQLLSKMNRLFTYSLWQAGALAQRLDERGLEPANAGLNFFLQQMKELPGLAPWRRLQFLLHYRVMCQNFLLTLLLYLQMSWSPLVHRARM